MCGSPISALLVAAAPATGLAAVLTDLAIITCVAAAITVAFQWLRLPVVLGYLLAGFLVGPHSPWPQCAYPEVARALSEFGVILLMFSLGLEFSLRRLVRIAPTAGLVAVIECSLVAWLGYFCARQLGWTNFESLFAAAMVAISSTTIIAKAFSENGIQGRWADLVFGILVAEDLIAIVLLTTLTAVASGAGLSAAGLASTVGRLMIFLAVLLGLGMLVLPRLIRFVARLGRSETLVVASVGVAFSIALLARRYGYPVALGAFLAGALVAESGQAKLIERLIRPIRDIFATVFFVSVGMLIQPNLIASHAGAVATLAAVVLVGKLAGVTMGAFVTGNGVRNSVQAGLSLGQIGEFSFIIAGVGQALGVLGDFFYPVAIAVSAVTTFLTPACIRLSGRVAAYLDRRLPHALQTYATLYGSWVSQLGQTRQHGTAWSRIRRLVFRLLGDLVLIAAIVIASAINLHRLVDWVRETIGLQPRLASVLIGVAIVLVILPFLLGAARLARALGFILAQEALPSANGGLGGLDLADAPRRTLLVTLQLAILLAAGAPLVAVMQPFLPSFPFVLFLLLGIAVLAVPFWRSASDLHGHVRAGAQIVLEALAAQSHSGSDEANDFSDFRRVMPGLGEPSTLTLRPNDPAVGCTLKDLNVRGLTGATILAIERKPNEVVFPGPDERLRAHDVVVLTGTHESVEAAIALLRSAHTSTLSGTDGDLVG